jgi:hypothetical protein
MTHLSRFLAKKLISQAALSRWPKHAHISMITVFPRAFNKLRAYYRNKLKKVYDSWPKSFAWENMACQSNTTSKVLTSEWRYLLVTFCHHKTLHQSHLIFIGTTPLSPWRQVSSRFSSMRSNGPWRISQAINHSNCPNNLWRELTAGAGSSTHFWVS